MNQQIIDNTETARARSDNYALLAALFQSEPSAALLERLHGAEFQAMLDELGLSFGPDLFDRDLATLQEELGIEFTRLFIGPGPHVSPHESIFVKTGSTSDGEIYSPQTVKVKVFIEASGLRYDDDDRRLPDHLSTELEFMSRLAAFEAEKWGQGDSLNASGCLGIQKRFLDEHLARWISPFCDRVVEEDRLGFYAPLARLVEQVVALDHEIVGGSLAERPTGT